MHNKSNYTHVHILRMFSVDECVSVQVIVIVFPKACFTTLLSIEMVKESKTKNVYLMNR